jgi:hypothetical protein
MSENLSIYRTIHACLQSVKLIFISQKSSVDVDALTSGNFRCVQRRDVSATLVRRAESLGFKSVVLTVGTPVLGRREADIRNKYSADQSDFVSRDFLKFSETMFFKNHIPNFQRDAMLLNVKMS